MNYFRKIISSIDKSLHLKVLFSVLLALSTIIIFMEISNFYILQLYKRQAETTYQNSLRLYSQFWGNKFEVVNKSLVTLIRNENNSYFQNVLDSKDSLVFESNLIMLASKLDDLASAHNRQILTFCYIPSRDIYIKSTNNLEGYSKRYLLDESVKKAIDNFGFKNTETWRRLDVQDRSYFYQAYHMNNGYVGAIITADIIIDNLLEDESVNGSAALLDTNDDMVFQSDTEFEFKQSSRVFSQSLPMTNYKIGFIVSERNLYSQTALFVLIMLSVVVIGIIVIVLNMRIQMKVVINPLNKLKSAMERFSSGEMNVRLNEPVSGDEIRTLYRTFNSMAEQITDLKIDVYETEIEKLQIESGYLQLQIQPHFYTNILNLIYNLAEVNQSKSIQQIAMATSRYFRYLLSRKGPYVSIIDELECVNRYIEIQKMRYPGVLEYDELIEIELSNIILPPLIIQTFVENSIIHNITMVSILKISVSIRVLEDNVIIVIDDNGLGFPGDLKNKLNSNQNISIEGKHIGITNAKQRLHMFYGPKAEVKIINSGDITSVRIKLPYREAEEQ